MANIYIVEDDTNIQEIEAIALKNSGHSVEQFDDAAHFYKKLEEKLPDLAILDLMLPDEDGYEIVKKLRQNPATKKLPVIMVTAKTSEIDMVRGLDIGADDYIVKPFSPGEVMARLRAVLRRITPPEEQKQQEGVIRMKNLYINLEEYTFKVDDKRIPLTKKEIETMWTLASHPNKVFTRDNLLDSLWGYDYYGDSRTVDSHIKRLRSKLDSVEHPDWGIKTIWGVGYKFEVKEAE